MSLAILSTLAQIIVFALVAVVARRASTRARAIALGVAVGLTGLFAVGFLIGFVGHVLPVGQMDFWLAHQMQRLN